MSYETRGAGVASRQPSAASIQSRVAGRGQSSASSHQHTAAISGLRPAICDLRISARESRASKKSCEKMTGIFSQLPQFTERLETGRPEKSFR